MDLLARREAILQEHRRLQRQRGSGWHPADPGALEREQRGELDLAERPLAFQEDDLIRVVGPCAARIRGLFADFLARAQAEPARDLIGHGERWQAAVVKFLKRALALPGEDLVMPTQDWNYCNSGLAALGVQVTLTSA